MFDLIAGTRTQPAHGTTAPMVVSITAHVVVIGAVVAIPLLYVSEQLPEVPHMMAFVAAAPAPPPPPPPPPAPAAAATRAAKPIPAVSPTAAPIEAPSGVEPEPGIDRGSDVGVPGGVEGGVPGGLVGGIVGGIVSDGPLPPPPPPPVARAPIRVGGQLDAPALVDRVPPRYPELAVKARVQGIVILEATVDENGRVRETRVLRSVPLLDDAAVEAVRQWRYSPLRLNGEPYPFILTVTVSFKIPDTATAMP